MNEITCVGINNLNECCHATLGNGSFGCKYDRSCRYKRPEVYEYLESLQKELVEVKKINVKLVLNSADQRKQLEAAMTNYNNLFDYFTVSHPVEIADYLSAKHYEILKGGDRQVS
jgi:hypothetical protein